MIWILRKFFIFRDVKFVEDVFPFKTLENMTQLDNVTLGEDIHEDFSALILDTNEDMGLALEVSIILPKSRLFLLHRTIIFCGRPWHLSLLLLLLLHYLSRLPHLRWDAVFMKSS